MSPIIKRILFSIVYSILTLTILVHSQSTCLASVKQMRVFGVSLRIEVQTNEDLQHIEAEIATKSAHYTESWDPDCMWRKPQDGKCQPPKAMAETIKVEKLADMFRKETDGYFDIETIGKNGSRQRDFSGLSQGQFIEELRHSTIRKWIVDFAGDIFFSGGFKPSQPITIADPLNDSIRFAEVSMKAGWVLSSSARILGQNIRNPRAKQHEQWQENFQRVVLFAKPSFNGARLDAWATALIPGGNPLLKKLWANTRFSGQWAYLYFDRAGKPTCSSNIVCELGVNDPTKRIVRVPF